MTEPLQSFDWKSSNYERPKDSWVCGRVCESGTPCRLGPSSKGECQFQSRCQPEEKGGRYTCTRSVVNGGKCKEGPSAEGTCCQPKTDCQPRRSLLAKRLLLGIFAAMIAGTLCLISFNRFTASTLLTPGKVTKSHANLESNCSACHTAAEGGLTTWIQTAFDGEAALKDSALCLKCHTEMGENALFVHGVSTDRLTEITEQFQAKSEITSTPFALKLAAFTGPPATNHQLACSTCHREHHGREASLTHLTDLQCQSCHTRQFESFEHGHPTFEDYPYERRSRIYFDHAAHLNRYFVKDEFKRTMPNGQKPDSCRSCHTPDATGRIMLTGSFEKTCASCHEPQIEDIEFPGVPFFALPVIAPSMIQGQGEWPNTQGTFQTAKLPQFMELLLANDPQYQNAIEQLGDLDYRKLNNTMSEQHAAVAEIAWAIKKLLYDITNQGEAALKQRLKNRAPEYLNLRPSIIPTLSQAQQIWFPNLSTEMKNHLEKKPILNEPKKQNQESPRTLPINKANGWYLSEADFTIRYRPIGHADPLIKGWLDQVIQTKTESLDDSNMWRIFSNPTASGTEASNGALASGRCLLCHSVDENRENGTSTINWLPFQSHQSEEQFTRFSHAPHLITDQKNNCVHCHQFEKSVKEELQTLQSDYFTRNQTNLFWQINRNSRQTCTSGFQPISRQTCVTCHNKSTATQSCLQCHQYHTHDLTVTSD
ncbi:hypothetical protein [Gimesia aquarii]|uniref:Doubled CXXCH motif n=1 Tax=Gimesia aquarii TaxID=2527964 RepID=A0A517WUW8_9PLAN|nr:hypothetical protein [Gimesia aquarii]QDU09022.1 Doubled CXXCH motif [Gimesia aquarii]